MSVLEAIKNDIGLSQSIECLEKGLIYLFLNKTIATKELASKMEVPVATATAFKKELVKHGWMKRESFYFLTSPGKNYVIQELNYQGVHTEFYKSLLNDDLAMNNFLESISQSLQEVYVNRPLVKKELDQAHATIETLIKRVILLLKNPLIFSKRVAFIGDDDLTSIIFAKALSELGNTSSDNIYVLDVDNELLEFINNNNKSLVKINTIKQDFRNEMKFSNLSADIIITDPPYTSDGLLTFITISNELLREGGIIYLSFNDKSPQIQRYVQNKINDLGYNFIEIKPSFNDYLGGSIIGNISNLYILQKSSISHTVVSNNGIYTQSLKKSSDGRRLGFHSLYELRECDEKLLTNIENVRNSMTIIVNKFNLNVVTENFHQFNPYGVSGVMVLEESHFTIHTWPEYKYAAIDLFLCKDTMNERKIMETLQGLFNSKYCEYKKIYRES